MCNDTLPNASALAISLSVLMSARDFGNFQITPFSGFKMTIRLAERTRPNAREETLIVLTSVETAINRVSHNEIMDY